MKKIILTSFLLVAGLFSTAEAFDGDFLDQVQNKIFQDKRVTIREAKILLELSSEAPQKKVARINITEPEEMMVSSEDSTVQEIKEPVLSKTRRDFSFLIAPKRGNSVAFFEMSDRNFPTALEVVRERQRRARRKAEKYANMFRR